MTITAVGPSRAPAGPALVGPEERMVTILGRAAGRFRLAFTERTLFAVGGALAVAGVLCILVGWEGTSRTVLVAGQIPYLVSGGLLGLGLIFLGGFLYFGHWMALLVGENRERSAEDRNDLARIREHLDQLNETLAGLVGVLGGASTGGSAVRTPVLVGTLTGTMMHRPDCAAVVGRENIRRVRAGDGLRPCGLCRPLDSDAR
ncbi:MAG TPA: hypothetical protein VNF50_11815 [Acidimicrobiales bacterium]|nr:hypothetical protein [Acidimicrobiales bacterium]